MVVPPNLYFRNTHGVGCWELYQVSVKYNSDLSIVALEFPFCGIRYIHIWYIGKSDRLIRGCQTQPKDVHAIYCYRFT